VCTRGSGRAPACGPSTSLLEGIDLARRDVVEFYAARRGRLVGALIAVLSGVLIALAKFFSREGFHGHSLIGLVAIPCLVAAIGLIYLKPWARLLALAVLLTLIGWIALDLYRLEALRAFPIWYRPVPLIGNDAAALQVVGGVLLVLYVLLSWVRYAFYPPENLIPGNDAL
jgi:hypothetical protein